MRIDNPINPNQNVRNHILSGGIWVPSYGCSDSYAQTLDLHSVGTTQLIAGVAGKRIVVLYMTVYCYSFEGAGTGGVNANANVEWANGKFVGSATFGGAGGAAQNNLVPYVFDFPGGLDLGDDGDALNVISNVASTFFDVNINIGFTMV